LKTALVALAIGSCIGRWRLVPVMSNGALTRGSAVLLSPVPTSTLKAGDVVLLAPEGSKRAKFHRVVQVVDSWQRRLRVDDGKHQHVADLPPTAWKAGRKVPYLGLPFGLLTGPIQAALLILNGVLMVALGQSNRGPTTPPDSSHGRLRGRRRARPPARIAAAACISMLFAIVAAALSVLI
jgi:hypothetical protein